MVSIVCARLGMAALATDGDAPTLPLLRANLLRNGAATSAAVQLAPAAAVAPAEAVVVESPGEGDPGAADPTPPPQPFVTDTVAEDGAVAVGLLRWGAGESVPSLCADNGSSSEGSSGSSEGAAAAGSGDGTCGETARFAPRVLDLLVASDVVYGDDLKVWQALIATLRQRAAAGTLVLIAQTRRYKKEDVFFRLLRRHFRCTALPQRVLHPSRAGQKTADGELLFTVWACQLR